MAARGDTLTTGEQARPIDSKVRIGHVHLKVADLGRALRFYCGVLGFEITQRYGTQAAFVSAGGYHHIGLNTWESLGGSPPPPGTTGLSHTAIRYPTRRALTETPRRVMAAGIPLDGAAITGSARRCNCVTRTTMAWNCIGTARRTCGPGRRRASWQ